jgi:large subunit ribosomal protein L21
MKYAIIELAGKQYRVHEGFSFVVDRLDAEPDQEIKVDRVLLVGDDESSTKEAAIIGAPVVEKAIVTLRVVDQFRATKIRVATYKSKSRYRKVRGHRQHQTTVLTTKITG